MDVLSLIVFENFHTHSHHTIHDFRFKNKTGKLGVISDTCVMNIQTTCGKRNDSFSFRKYREMQCGALTL